jgi:hypothetical protein
MHNICYNLQIVMATIELARTDEIPLATEFFRLASGDRVIEIANYHSDGLTAEEQSEIASAFATISNFTEGKIWDRVSSLDLVPAHQLPDPELEGDYELTDQKVRVNLDLARQPDPTFGPFRDRFFPKRPVSVLQFSLAHESGHAMDVQYLDEIAAHGIDKDVVAPGWRSYCGKSNNFSAFSLSDSLAEEGHLTKRSKESAREDFADSFAVAALGGDVLAVPNRLRRLSETIKLAKGRQTSPQPVEIEKIA